MLHATYVGDDFFMKPFSSSKLNILAAKSKLSNNKGILKTYLRLVMKHCIPLMKLCMFCIPYHKEFVFLPLIHTLDKKQ